MSLLILNAEIGIAKEGEVNWYHFEELKMVDGLCPRALMNMQGLCCGNAPLAPSRRRVVGSIGLLVVAALPPWIAGAPSKRDIIVIEGWILADTDLR